MKKSKISLKSALKGEVGKLKKATKGIKGLKVKKLF
jgi:hypothetical protein